MRGRWKRIPSLTKKTYVLILGSEIIYQSNGLTYIYTCTYICKIGFYTPGANPTTV
jgi:hypothetical protein